MPKFIMSDGREFTDYQPSCALNQALQQKYNVKDVHQYRYYLQKNAEQVMKDLADCDTKRECALCPVCQQAVNYKP
jgi:hypothetical protein